MSKDGGICYKCYSDTGEWYFTQNIKILVRKVQTLISFDEYQLALMSILSNCLKLQYERKIEGGNTRNSTQTYCHYDSTFAKIS